MEEIKGIEKEKIQWDKKKKEKQNIDEKQFVHEDDHQDGELEGE